jgi:Domain of unknown function (DUF4331)
MWSDYGSPGYRLGTRLPKSEGAAARVLGCILCFYAIAAAFGSDHLDSPTVTTNPRADIGDLYAWISPDGQRLNLVMTIVGGSLSENIEYAFHVGSGRRFGATTVETSIVCRPVSAKTLDCRVGELDWAHGDARDSAGLMSRKRRLRVFAGPRDDPFFNNVKGTRNAYRIAAAALETGVAVDAAGCPAFDALTAWEVMSTWRQTEGGPASNFLAGWIPAALVVSIDVELIDGGGPMLAVWATTTSEYGQLDRMGRPLTGNALLGTISSKDVSDRLKEQYNGATPANAESFVAEIEKSLALYDGFDAKCGNQLLADTKARGAARYRPLASVLADDRLWVNSASSVCTQFMAVEQAQLQDDTESAADCGGRTPTYPAVNVYRSLLVDGTRTSVDDGLSRDEQEHSAARFPFLAPPQRESAGEP